MKLFTTECTKCNKTIKKSEAQQILVNQRIYQVCKACAWDLECWLHQAPLQFGDYIPFQVKEAKEP